MRCGLKFDGRGVCDFHLRSSLLYLVGFEGAWLSAVPLIVGDPWPSGPEKFALSG